MFLVITLKPVTRVFFQDLKTVFCKFNSYDQLKRIKFVKKNQKKTSNNQL